MRTILKNITVYCDKLIIALLITAVVVVPLFFDIRLYSVFDLSKVMALYLLTIAILVTWLIILACKDDFRFLHTAIGIPVLAYIFIFIVSSAISINPIMSLFGTYKRFEGLTATLCYIFIFYATVNFVTTKKRLYLIVISILGGAVISSCYGIAQHLGFDFFKWSSFEARRVFSTFGNPVFFSAYLVMILPLAVVLFFSKSSQHRKKVLEKILYGIADSNQVTTPSKGREAFLLKKGASIGKWCILWIFYVISAIIYTAFWLTNTRACFVALLGGLTPLLYLIFKKQTAERYKFAALVILFVLIGVFFNVRHETSVIKHFAGDVRTTESSAENLIFDKIQTYQRPWIANKFSVTGSSFSRIFQYLAATMIIKDYPALGIGPDTIGIIYQKNLAKVFSVQESDKGFPFPRQDRIHNDILDTAVTRGIFGLGTYIWLLAAFGTYIGKNYKQLNNQNKLLVLGLLAGIICYLIQNEFSFGNTPIVMLFWVMMALCISIVKINEIEEGLGANVSNLRIEESGKPGHPNLPTSLHILYRWLGCGITLAAIGFVTIFVLRFYRADAYFEYGRRILEYEKENLQTMTEKGIYFIRHALVLNPYETFYRDELCRTYIQMAFKTKDEVWIQKAYVEANNTLRLIPQHYMGLFHLGMIYQFLTEHFNRNTTDAAIAYYKKAIDADPFQSIFHSNLASMYNKKGQLDQAIEELLQAYLIRPEDVNHADRLANAYLKKGDLENALIFSRKAIQLNPAEPGYYNNLGAILSRKGMYEEAIDAFKKAIEIDPKDTIYLENLTKLYLSLGKYRELIPYYKKLIGLNPSMADYHNNLGVVYKKEKQLDDAMQSFQKALSLKPDNPIYTYNLADTVVERGQHDEARRILQTFDEMYPNHKYANIHLLLAELYAKNMDWEKVAYECERAVKINEKSFAAYKMLGYAYYNMQQYKLAEKIVNNALALNPNDQDAKDLLVKISNKIN
ncbi:MAG: tetratricopeptide repeat protein [Candidatus Brocadia sp.]|jgi:tetratricopeptide (TPR) repeat protein